MFEWPLCIELSDGNRQKNLSHHVLELWIYRRLQEPGHWDNLINARGIFIWKDFCFCFFVSREGLQLGRKIDKEKEEERVAVIFSFFDEALDSPCCFLSAKQLKLNKLSCFLTVIHEFYVLIILYAICLFSVPFYLLRFLPFIFLLFPS